MPNNEIYYNAALSGFLRGVYTGRNVAQWAGLGVAGVLATAEAFAVLVDSLIPFDAEVTTSSINPAQLTVQSSQDIAREQWRGTLLEGLCFSSVSRGAPSNSTNAALTDAAQQIATTFGASAAALLASFAPVPPPPNATYVLDSDNFTFSTASPLLLLSIQSGDILDGAVIVITTDFNDPAAHVMLGTPAFPSLFLDVSPALVSQFSTPQIEEFAAVDQLQLRITGASTTGAGYVAFRVQR